MGFGVGTAVGAGVGAMVGTGVGAAVGAAVMSGVGAGVAMARAVGAGVMEMAMGVGAGLPAQPAMTTAHAATASEVDRDRITAYLWSARPGTGSVVLWGAGDRRDGSIAGGRVGPGSSGHEHQRPL